jgi:hypothetical protein
MRKPGACLDCPNSRSTIHLDRKNRVAPEVGTASGDSTGWLGKKDVLNSLSAVILESKRSRLPWSGSSQGKTGRWTASKGTSLPPDGRFDRVAQSLGFAQRLHAAKKSKPPIRRRRITAGSIRDSTCRFEADAWSRFQPAIIPVGPKQTSSILEEAWLAGVPRYGIRIELDP